MITSASIGGGLSPHPIAVVVPAFSGMAERFVLRAFRLIRRSLLRTSGDAGQVLGKHLRTRVPADAVDAMLGDLSALLIEISFFDNGVHTSAITAKWSSKHEFFLIAMIEGSQRGDMARATESAIALLETFEVRAVLEASTAVASRLAASGLRLMPIGDAAFNYFADYKPVQEPARRSGQQPIDPLGRPLQLVASGSRVFPRD